MPGGLLNLSDLTLGVSQRGMYEYKDRIRAELLVKSKAKINDIDAVKASIDAGWQGVSKEKFYKDFKQAREKIIDDLEKEYKNLIKRIDEIENSYFDIDKKLMGGN